MATSTAVSTEWRSILFISFVPYPFDRTVLGQSVYYRCLLLEPADSQTRDKPRPCALLIPLEGRKRGVMASGADVPFRCDSVVAGLRYHLLPALPCRPPPASGGTR